MARRVPLVALLTDFGQSDGYPGVMKAIIAGLAPGVALVDLTHEIAPQDVRAGAWILYTVWRYLPVGVVCLAVVDPGVGTTRRPIAVAADGRLFVGPDNGLLGYVLNEHPASAAVELNRPQFHLATRSATFHGRDIFAPVAGHLAAGQPLDAVGTPIPPASLVALALPRPQTRGADLLGEVVHVDHFGNLVTTFGPGVAQAVLDDRQARLLLGGTVIAARAATFASGPADTPFMLLDSSGHVAVAVRNGSASDRLGIGVGAQVVLPGAASLISEGSKSN